MAEVDGYVALLDVLGFTETVLANKHGEKMRDYLGCISETTKEAGVKAVVFSDSIVLTAGDDEQALLDIIQTCSRLLGRCLDQGIPLRGAISYGSVNRESLDDSVFIAGRAIVDAYRFEQAQDWIGVIVAPSAIEQVKNLGERCDLRANNLNAIRQNLDWGIYVQPFNEIPFKAGSSIQDYNGYAVVPTVQRNVAGNSLYDDLFPIIMRLDWLSLLAPNPETQQKYIRTSKWLFNRLLSQRAAIQNAIRTNPLQ
jgi:hypothetical protein